MPKRGCKFEHVVIPAKGEERQYCGMECWCGDWNFCDHEDEEHKNIGCNCPVPVKDEELV